MCLWRMTWIFIASQTEDKMETIQACFLPGAAGLLSPLQDFLDDAQVSEILINRPQEVFVEKHGILLRVEIPVFTSQYLRRLFMLIANENKQTLSEHAPMLSGNLQDGSRVQLVIPPASRFETLSIRKFTLQSLNFQEYESQGFFNEVQGANLGDDASSPHENEQVLQHLYQTQNWQAFLTQAVLCKKNIMISGGTSSGKTTFLNSCLGEVPLNERLIILEDTYEINVSHQNVVRLKALKQLGEKAQPIGMQDLVQASLRLRPDRIIMGEIRGREIFDFVSACSTGHRGAFATIHANHPKAAFMRMVQLYKLNQVSGMNEADVYNILHEIIDVVIQLEKTKNGRRLVEVYYKHAR
jgi:type IV secretion system protein VirB11